MSEEPSYLVSLGEFATLKNAIGSWHHQNAYLFSSTRRTLATAAFFRLENSNGKVRVRFKIDA